MRGQEEIDKHPWPDLNLESLKRAEVLFHKALEYDSTYAQAYDGLASILWIKSDPTRNNNLLESSILKRYVDSSLVLADLALSYDDHLEGPYIIRASYYQFYRNLNKTIAEYDKAIRYNPNNFWAYLRKGWVYEDFDILKSLQNYQKAASLNHGQGLLMTIGGEYFQAGFPDKGKDFFLEALKLDGDSTNYSDNLMRYTAGNQGDYKKLINYFEKRRLTDSTNTFLLLDLGYCNTYSGNYKESLKYFKKYLSTIKMSDLDNPKIELYIGYSYLKNGYRKEAEYFFNRQIESYNNIYKSGFPEVRHLWNYLLASIYASMGDKVKAYENLNLFIQCQSLSLIWVNRLKYDPMLSSIRNEPEFQKIQKDAEAKYQALHESVKKWLEDEGKI